MAPTRAIASIRAKVDKTSSELLKEILMRTSRAISVGAATLAILGLSVPAAQASDNDNFFSLEACNAETQSDFDFHIYYNSGLNGSYRNIGYAVYNFNALNVSGYNSPVPLKFCNKYGASAPWPGSGQLIKNNAASGWNAHYKYTANVYYHSAYKGIKDVMWPGQSHAQFTNVYNQNASFNWTS